MRIALASDHAGFEMKEELEKFLKDLGHEVKDFGAHELNPADDYPDFITPAAKAVAGDEIDRAIILGGSGQGEAMMANRFKGVRAVVYYGHDIKMVSLSREHNNANILSLGARFIGIDEAREAVELWLETDFSGKEKYKRRNREMDE